MIFCICDGLPENCQCIIDRTHSKQCYDQAILDSDEQSVIKSASSLSLSDTRSESSDLSEGLSLSDSSEDNKPSNRKAENLESSHSSCSPMYHKISNNALDIHGEKVINEKLGSFDEANFSNGIIPIKEIEHLDTVGNQICFSNPVLSSVNEELSIASSNSEATLDLQGSSPLCARNVNILLISIGFLWLRKVKKYKLPFSRCIYIGMFVLVKEIETDL